MKKLFLKFFDLVHFHNYGHMYKRSNLLIVYKLKKLKSFIKTLLNTLILKPNISEEFFPFSMMNIFKKRKEKVAFSKIPLKCFAF